jgi:predicted nucleotidyltransferase
MIPELSAQEQAALTEYQTRLLSRFPHRIRRIALFGSKARGDAGSESDLDVLVVLGDGQKSRDGFYSLGLTDPIWREIVGMTFDLLMEYGVDMTTPINPYVAGNPVGGSPAFIRRVDMPMSLSDKWGHGGQQSAANGLGEAIVETK